MNVPDLLQRVSCKKDVSVENVNSVKAVFFSGLVVKEDSTLPEDVFYGH